MKRSGPVEPSPAAASSCDQFREEARLSSLEFGLRIARDWMPAASAWEVEHFVWKARTLLGDHQADWDKVTIAETAWDIVAEGRGGIRGEPFHRGDFVRGFMHGVDLWSHVSARVAADETKDSRCITCGGELGGWYL